MGENSNSKTKLIAAGITLLLGIILAIGYPTGGVKANKSNRHYAVPKTGINNTLTNKAKQSVVKTEQVKKRRIIHVVPPPSNDDSQDEGC